ncbi:MAG: hypothetical protein K2Z81_00225, partial [Cyanobacteria bacterium]|nr:hypothetical protein [Cyanobacteriota bacterium]
HCDRTIDVSGRIPDGAEKKGSLEFGGGTLDVYRTREGDNLLVRDGRVIGRETRDGKYEFTSGDSTFRDVRISQDTNGRYNLDSFQQFREINGRQQLVRSKDGPITTQYSFDSSGNPVQPPQRTAVVATLQDMDALRSQVTDGNPLRVLVGDPSHPEAARRFFLQNHGEGLTSTTEFVTLNGQMVPRTVLHKGGQDYLWNASSQQLGIRTAEGELRSLTPAELQTLGGGSEQLRELLRQLHRRNQTGEEVGGVGLRWHPNHDQLDIVQHCRDRHDGQPDTAVTTTVGPTPEAGFVMVDNTGQTTTTIRPRGGIAARDNGVDSWTFDPTVGFDSVDFKITDLGLTHKPTGVTLDQDGNVKHADGSYWVDDEGNVYGEGEFFGEDGDEHGCTVAEVAAERAEVAAAKGAMFALGSAALSLSMSGNPWAAMSLAVAARNVIGSVQCDHAVNHNSVEFAKSTANGIFSAVERGLAVAKTAEGVSSAFSDSYARADLIKLATFGGASISGGTELAMRFGEQRGLITDPNQNKQNDSAA